MNIFKLYLAENINLLSETQIKLANNPLLNVRQRLASNKRLTLIPEVIAILKANCTIQN
jgi:hypothetical protein